MSSFRETVEAALREAGNPRHELMETGDTEGWIRVAGDARTPLQGWKLHVSATIASADAVLRAALPALVGEGCAFKVAASHSHLRDLNEGNGGLSQVGKFITVYPRDDQQVVQLAAALDAATRGLEGPPVPSDRPLSKGSLVHYRYGEFEAKLAQTPLGEIVSMISTPAGELLPDFRAVPYCPPKGWADPFVAAGIAADDHERSPLVAKRYLRVSALYRSPRGEVHLGADIEGGRACVIKTARRHSLVDEHGRDACERLEHEAGMLRSLRADRRFPEVLDLVCDENEFVLVIADLGGDTMEDVVCAQASRGSLPDTDQVVAWGQELAAMLGALHARGILYRDLKSSNVIVTAGGWLGLVDFESAASPDDDRPPFARGTRGYMSPQAHEGAATAVTDDVYGLGALLYFLATGAEPSQFQHPFGLLRRPVAGMNASLDSALEALIARCLEQDPKRRFQSMDDVHASLSAVRGSPSPLPSTIRGSVLKESELEARARSSGIARRLLDTICDEAEPVPGKGLSWTSRHKTAPEMFSRDVNSGVAGTLLALAQLAQQLDSSRAYEVLAEGARWLAESTPLEGTVLPGLYVGEAGVAAALLRSGQVLGEAALIDQAEQRAREIAAMPHSSPDLFNGTAGRVRMHLLFWDALKQQDDLDAAVLGAEILVREARSAGEGAVKWVIPEGYGGLSGQANLGYAHGAAGIADALLHLWEVSRDRRLIETASGAARWLERQGLPVLRGGTGLAWPSAEGESPAPAFWCHGAAGIGRFFLHAGAVGLTPKSEEAALAAARATAAATRWAGPTQCHGLAGSIEFLLDISQFTGDCAWLREARVLGRLLEAFPEERGDRLYFPSEAPDEFTPAYMVGYAGVAVTFLRLSNPEHIPFRLDSPWFKPSGESRASPVSRV